MITPIPSSTSTLSEVKTPDVVVEASPTPPEVKAPDVVAMTPISGGFKGRIPSQWAISPLDGDMIEASNSTSGETFKGTIAEFNQAMRG